MSAPSTPSGVPTSPLMPLAAAGYIPGQYLTSNVYAPASVTQLTVSTTVMSAFSSGTVCTGSFTAPASGTVVVQATFDAQISSGGNKVALGLAGTGTTTPMVGAVNTFTISNTTALQTFAPRFYVSGLTAGTAYNFDLLGCATTAVTMVMYAYGNTAATLGNAGAPVIITVQGA